MSGPERLAPGIEVVGQLSILADGSPLRVEFQGQVIELILPSLRTSLRVWRVLRRAERRNALRSLQTSMRTTGLELEVRVNRHLVGRLAPESRSGWLASWLGLDPMELKLRAVLAALIRQDSLSPDNTNSAGAGAGEK